MEQIKQIENLLENAGERGLSYKQMCKITNFSRKKIQFFIFKSMNIQDCNPIIHGSGQNKIRVFVFKPGDLNNPCLNYIQQKKLHKFYLKKSDNNIDIKN